MSFRRVLTGLLGAALLSGCKENDDSTDVLVSRQREPAVAPQDSSLVLFSHLSDEAWSKIGDKVWQNESGRKMEGLVAWNDGEAFASVGIGHFLWFPRGKTFAFRETFPAVLEFMEAQGRKLPVWLRQDRFCPWGTRDEFLREAKGSRAAELRQFLADNIGVQIRFIARRLESALPLILDTVEANGRSHIRKQFERMARGTRGVYALADYVNFKGEGTSPTERYNGEGWGLLQVLSSMSGTTSDPVREFADAAAMVLTRRVKNAPAARQEERWLAGWKARLRTYIDAVI